MREGNSGTLGYADGSCEEWEADDGVLDNNALLCLNGLEYVHLKTHVPEKVVSGSELMYGPVGYITMYDGYLGSSTFASTDTVVDIYRDYTDPRGDQMPPQTGKETETFNPVPARYTQPFLATLANQGYYQIEYTGDIASFNEEFLEFSLVSLGLDEPLYSDEWAVMVQYRFLKAVNVAFYYDGRQVSSCARRDQLSLDSSPGKHYLDPVSKILSFPVIGLTKPVRIRQLDVVSVDFGLTATFANFFEDNYIDPNAIDSAFEDQVPPTYAATYDPDNGNIVRSNTFVRNLASILNINPSRIRVVNIVPGNRRRRLLNRERAEDPGSRWKRVLTSTDDDDDGINVEFEISAVDPCEDVVCQNGGDCNADGECDCASGFRGPTCNTTVVNCTALTPMERIESLECNNTAPSPVPTVTPSAVPSVSPTTATVSPTPGTFAPTAAPTNATTSANSDSYSELINVADTLTTAAGSGDLDTGYEVSEVVVALPDDVCGVAGGDGDTCDDACGVANGDNSTCADSCGVPNGDGASCLTTDSGFYTCERNDEDVLNDKQAIFLRGSSMSGKWRLSFNGRETVWLSPYATDGDVLIALTDLDTIGTVLVTCNQTFSSDGTVDGLDVLVEFDRVTGTNPQHYGSMPLIMADTAHLSGVTYTKVTHVCTGEPRANFVCEEQLVTVGGDYGLNGSVALTVDGNGTFAGERGHTAWIATSATALEVTEALAAARWSSGTHGFELSADYLEVFHNGSDSEAGRVQWVVRFYPTANSDLLKLTVLGDLPPLRVNNTIYTDGGTTKREVVITELVKGSVPASAMPVSATEAAAESGEQAVEEAAEVETTTADVVAVVHVCGDSSRTTAEACDDGNAVDGDGCNRNCTVEAGFVCTTDLLDLSECKVPVEPTLYFAQTTFGPFKEGSNGSAIVSLMGTNITSEITVKYRIAASSAYPTLLQNDYCATAGDFNATDGELTFSPGESEQELFVQLLEDGVWEQTLVENEKLAVVLYGATGADIDETRNIGYIGITDLDHKNVTIGYCLTPVPTAAPSSAPSAPPSAAPTFEPTAVPTDSPYTVTLATVTSAFVLSDVSASDISSRRDLSVFKDVLVAVIDVISSRADVTKVNVTDVSDRRRRALGQDTLEHVNRALLATSAQVTFTFDVILDDTGYDDGDDLLEAVSADLISAVNDSSLESTIRTKAASKGLTTLASVSVDKKASRQAIDEVGAVETEEIAVPDPTFAPTPAPIFWTKRRIAELITSAAAIGMAAGFVLFLILVWYFLVRRKKLTIWQAWGYYCGKDGKLTKEQQIEMVNRSNRPESLGGKWLEGSEWYSERNPAYEQMSKVSSRWVLASNLTPI